MRKEAPMKPLIGVAALLVLLAVTACRTGKPLWDSSHDNDNAPGTIAGIVSEAGGERLSGRRVYAVHLGTGERYSAVTNVTGGFSIPVPPGKYRLEVVLNEGETVVRRPGVIDINESDLDANLEIVIKP
jgi:Carboxypeptidase regulatory-like domain